MQIKRMKQGFTAVELMVTVAIVAILAAIALPTLQTTSTTAEANALYAALQYARSAAVKQGQSVIVCPTSNTAATAPVCSTGSAWNTGWLVVASGTGTCTITTTTGTTSNGDVILQTQQAFSSKDTATFSGSTNIGFCFTRMGFSYNAYTGIVTFKSSPAVAKKQRCTMVSGVGHVQVVNQGNNDALGVTCT